MVRDSQAQRKMNVTRKCISRILSFALRAFKDRRSKITIIIIIFVVVE